MKLDKIFENGKVEYVEVYSAKGKLLRTEKLTKYDKRFTYSRDYTFKQCSKYKFIATRCQ